MSIRRGEVLALCGENGAGKSTLIKILTGAVAPSEGHVVLDGEILEDATPRKVIEAGVAAIYQEFSLVPFLTVAENIFYGREISRGGIRDIAEMNRQARELCQRMGVRIDVQTQVSHLGVAYQQIVEILKAVATDAKFIIMDEPTAPLTVTETEVFFGIVKQLRANRTTILFVSHRLEEVFQLCDRVAVLCDGRFVITKKVSEVNERELISYMVGRELSSDYPRPSRDLGEPVLRVSELANTGLSGVSFELRRGEILGFGGLVGAGRTELARAIFGADRIHAGDMILNGRPYAPGSTKAALRRGVGLIPEDRKRQGVVTARPIRDNITYSTLRRLSSFGVIKSAREKKLVSSSIDNLRIKTTSSMQLVRNLSGGNQQKVVLAKILATDCDLLIFDEPTRGIDVGAKQEIYRLMCDLVERGKSVILISSEMPELMGMSDRIIVMRNGRVAGELKRDEFSQQLILEVASGLETDSRGVSRLPKEQQQ